MRNQIKRYTMSNLYKYKEEEKVTEWCPYCDLETELEPIFQKQNCQECGEDILPCSMCIPDKVDCSNCPIENSKALKYYSLGLGYKALLPNNL